MEKTVIKVCNHFKTSKLKSFDFKLLKREEIFCDFCKKSDNFKKSKEGLDSSNLLVCLECLQIGCNRYTENKCMVKHYEEENHSVTYSLSSGAMWCYLCDYELKEFLVLQGIDKTQENFKKELEKYSKDQQIKIYKLLDYKEKVDENFKNLFELHKNRKIENDIKKIEEENKNSNKIEEENDDEQTPKSKYL